MQIAEHVSEVAADVYRVRLPLPFALNSVNCYLLRGAAGWTVLDSGLHLPAGEAGWRTAFAALKITPADIHQIVLTHFHPDHYGMAGWLQQWCQQEGAGSLPPVWMAPREAELAGMVWELRAGQPEPIVQLFQTWGAPESLIATIAEAVAHLRQMTLPHPVLVQHLEPGTQISLGSRQFVALHTPGHSDGHLVFYDAADRLLLCGDQVLMKITPHIGTWPESEPDPLGRYLASLRELVLLDVRLALPGHGPLVTDWQGRLAELDRHHAVRLEQMLAAVGDGATPFEVSARVFDFTRLTPHEIRFALAETVSHLDLLARQGHLRHVHDGNILRYLVV